MTKKLGSILAIDQGTTNTKALLIDARGKVIAQATCPVQQHYPQPAWIEQDAQALWQSVREAINMCLAASTDPPEAIAITNQRESVVMWERHSGRPLGPVISWQCRRTASFCADLRERGLAEQLLQTTGLPIDPLFSASKMNWLLAHTPDGPRRAALGEICLGTVDSWILWNITGGKVHACDMTNASRTQLFDIHTLHWNDTLLSLFGIPAVALPEVRASSADFGRSIELDRLPAGIPIFAMIGDSHAALFGQTGFQPGAIKATYGTGSSLMAPIPDAVLSKHGLSTTIAWALKQEHVTYALEGNISISGAAIQWVGEFLGLEQPAEKVAELAAQAEDAGGLYLVPAFVGLGAPYWNDVARGQLSGITRGTTARHLARAALEAIAYQVRDVFDVIAAETETDLSLLLADGGASHNALLMQFQADMLGRPVVRQATIDASALGAAYLAGLASGHWQTLDDLIQLPRSQTIFTPGMAPEQRATLYNGWLAAVARTLHQADSFAL